jgi:hypothetical protein
MGWYIDYIEEKDKKETKGDVMNQGTPKCLEQAIMNAYMDQYVKVQNNQVTKEIQEVIASHVRDFLRQHLTVANLKIGKQEPQEILDHLCHRLGVKNAA